MPVMWAAIRDIPTTPPSMTLFGVRKTSRPNVYMREPKAKPTARNKYMDTDDIKFSPFSVNNAGL